MLNGKVVFWSLSYNVVLCSLSNDAVVLSLMYNACSKPKEGGVGMKVF